MLDKNIDKDFTSKGLELLEEVESLKAFAEGLREKLEYPYNYTMRDYYEDIEKHSVVVKKLLDKLNDWVYDIYHIEPDDALFSVELNEVDCDITRAIHSLDDLVDYYDEHMEYIDKMTKWTCLPW